MLYLRSNNSSFRVAVCRDIIPFSQNILRREAKPYACMLASTRQDSMGDTSEEFTHFDVFNGAKIMSKKATLLLVTILIIGVSPSLSQAASNSMANEIAKGKYLVEIGGCNDCHTSGYAPSAGKVPENQWLTGDGLGFRGPWGTTYAPNLRSHINKLSEEEWIARSRSIQTRPPMPWWILNAMNQDDLRAIHRYIRSLGNSDNRVPAYLPPGEEPTTPFILWPG